jgi:hypothetical protein
MKSLLLTLVTLILTASNIHNSSVKASFSDDCPRIRVYCGENSCCGEKRIFSSMIQTSEQTRQLTFKWSVSSGKIIKGQGDGEIEVDARGVKEPLEVTLEVGNLDFPIGCPTTAKYKTECQNNCSL